MDKTFVANVKKSLQAGQLTSNFEVNSAKMPKKASVVVILPSSPKKEATLQNSSIALCCRDSRDCTAGWLFSKKPYAQHG